MVYYREKWLLRIIGHLIEMKQGPMNGHSCHQSIVTFNINTSLQDHEFMKPSEVRISNHKPKVKLIHRFGRHHNVKGARRPPQPSDRSKAFWYIIAKTHLGIISKAQPYHTINS